MANYFESRAAAQGDLVAELVAHCVRTGAPRFAGRDVEDIVAREARDAFHYAREVVELRVETALSLMRAALVDATDEAAADRAIAAARRVLVPPTTPVRWVNAYDVWEDYGGPEEGGWFFERGLPLAAIPCHTDDDILFAKARLRQFNEAAAGWNVPLEQERYRTDSHFVIRVEDEPAAAYPDRKPHYE